MSAVEEVGRLVVLQDRANSLDAEEGLALLRRELRRAQALGDPALIDAWAAAIDRYTEGTGKLQAIAEALHVARGWACPVRKPN